MRHEGNEIQFRGVQVLALKHPFFISGYLFFFLSHSNMSDESVIALGEKFQQLRNRPGKYDGAEYDETVDSFEGEKYKVMKVGFFIRVSDMSKVDYLFDTHISLMYCTGLE